MLKLTCIFDHAYAIDRICCVILMEISTKILMVTRILCQMSLQDVNLVWTKNVMAPMILIHDIDTTLIFRPVHTSSQTMKPLL